MKISGLRIQKNRFAKRNKINLKKVEESIMPQ